MLPIYHPPAVQGRYHHNMVTIRVFFPIRLQPGDPLTIILGQNAGNAQMSEETQEHFAMSTSR